MSARRAANLGAPSRALGALRLRALAVGTAVAALATFPHAALGDPTPPPNCTFERGVTTCVETSVRLLSTREVITPPCVSVIGTIEVTTRTSNRHGLRGRVFYEAVQRSQVERDFGCIP